MLTMLAVIEVNITVAVIAVAGYHRVEHHNGMDSFSRKSWE